LPTSKIEAVERSCTQALKIKADDQSNSSACNMDPVAGSIWKDCKAVYPPIEEICTALQDLGKHQVVKIKGKEVRQHRYPLVEKLAAKIYASIQGAFSNPEGLTKNVSRGKMTLVRDIIIRRRYTDIAETDPFFHKYGNDGKVYIVTNSTEHAGLDVCLKSFQEAIEASLSQKNSARTSNDGLRLGCILLDSKYRGSVSGIMSKKKSKQKCDILEIQLIISLNTFFRSLSLTGAIKFSHLQSVTIPSSLRKKRELGTPMIMLYSSMNVQVSG
jgi:hypothetical protein